MGNICSHVLGNECGHILYTDNPVRRERVTELAELLRSNVEQVYTICVNTSVMMNRICQDFNVVPPIDLTKTYNENFDIMKATFAQWAKLTEHLQNGEEVTAETRKLIYDINNATDAKAFSEHAHTVIDQLSNAAYWSSIIIIPVLGTVLTGGHDALSIRSALTGMAVGVVVDMIIGALDGARERSELEARAAELQEAIDKLGPEVTNLQNQVSDIILESMQLQAKTPNLQNEVTDIILKIGQ